MKLYCSVIIIIIALASPVWADGVTVEQLAKTTMSWNGRSLPDYSDSETEVTVLRITVEPHTRLPVHFHPVVNVAYMLEGELTVVADDGQKKLIGEGQSLVELVGQDHYGINESDRPARLVVVYFGEKNEPITVKE